MSRFAPLGVVAGFVLLVMPQRRAALAVMGIGLLLSACTASEHPQSADDAYQACLSRARSNDLVTRPGGAQSLQRGFSSDRRRDDMEALPAVRSQSPLDQCNDLRARGRL